MSLVKSVTTITHRDGVNRRRDREDVNIKAGRLREERGTVSRFCMRSSATSNLPAKIASRYVPLRIIGKGGMGVVYEVRHEWTAERLALKVLPTSVGASSEARERFRREARASAQIKSENVVRVTDADVSPELDGAPFLVMELLEGTDLEQAASAAKPDPATAVGWLRQIAPALDKAHRLGIVHRDLKPENLFLATVEDGGPIVKILDFGIAKMAQEGTGATSTGQILGTPKYMAPEQVMPGARITPATDRCALGLIAYRLVVGESYYRGDLMSILAEVMHAPLQAPSTRDPTSSPAFDAWFLKACHRTPEQRFVSAVEQIEALAEALQLPRAANEGAFTLSSMPPVADVEAALSATTVSHLSLRSPTMRRGLFASMVLFALTAIAAFLYRATARVEHPRSAAAAATTEPIEPSRAADRTAPDLTPPSPAATQRATRSEPASNSGAPGSASKASRPPSDRTDLAAKSRAPVAPARAPAESGPPRSDPYSDQK